MGCNPIWRSTPVCDVTSRGQTLCKFCLILRKTGTKALVRECCRLNKHWIAFCRCSRAIWIASERIAVHLICYSFRCNSYGPWTPTKCDSILIFTSFNNKVCRDIAYFNTKMSYLSDFKRTTLRTDKQTDDELNNAAVWSDPVQIIPTKDWHF